LSNVTHGGAAGRLGRCRPRLTNAGAATRPGSPAEFGAFIGDEKARWAKVVKDSGEKFE
jgi:hypothetical protein